ncbi:hypothetical protein SISSUDRAFT_570775 [Sistotremastrum suecicum HHB10207 ss-3]|uniref:Uncharacterized protein n=1 Tax=Sistotremastrum suecicum HHB10207 ss-3 TaxID=1314776 RepID=A0A166ER21_9AGAM|nr:hypothetical protein SISSUDRAFT_570775 [Sistotremastrum suecicum HHB10207 ss-3]
MRTLGPSLLLLCRTYCAFPFLSFVPRFVNSSAITRRSKPKSHSAGGTPTLLNEHINILKSITRLFSMDNSVKYHSRIVEDARLLLDAFKVQEHTIRTREDTISKLRNIIQNAGQDEGEHWEVEDVSGSGWVSPLDNVPLELVVVEKTSRSVCRLWRQAHSFAT